MSLSWAIRFVRNEKAFEHFNNQENTFCTWIKIIWNKLRLAIKANCILSFIESKIQRYLKTIKRNLSALVQYTRACFCGNTMDTVKFPRVPESECNMPCSKEKSRMCGGGCRNSIYYVWGNFWYISCTTYVINPMNSVYYVWGNIWSS